MREQTLESRLEEYWDWVAVSLFLLLTVDLLTSLFAARAVGVEHEANPLMAWLLVQPTSLIVGVHLLALLLAVLFFYGLFELLRETEPRVRRPMLWLVEVYIGVLVTVGLFVFANNLAVIVHGQSLL